MIIFCLLIVKKIFLIQAFKDGFMWYYIKPKLLSTHKVTNKLSSFVLNTYIIDLSSPKENPTMDSCFNLRFITMFLHKWISTNPHTNKNLIRDLSPHSTLTYNRSVDFYK